MNKFSHLTKKEKKVLNEFKQKISQQVADELLELKLFGSKARGDSRKDSDIDILVVLKSGSKEKENLIVDLTVEILLKYGIDISPHIYSQKEYSYLNKIPSVFMQILQKEAFAL